VIVAELIDVLGTSILRKEKLMESIESCAVCGATPAKVLKLRRCVGMVIAWRWVSLDQPFCKEHGQEAAKSWLGQTIVMGWWSVISFFANIVAVLCDVTALAQASALPPAQKRPANYF
jgi:hypothetical protein